LAKKLGILISLALVIDKIVWEICWNSALQFSLHVNECVSPCLQAMMNWFLLGLLLFRVK